MLLSLYLLLFAAAKAIFGKSLSQVAICIPLQAQFFGKIQQNGYKVLYLSARAIGQVRPTFVVLGSK